VGGRLTQICFGEHQVNFHFHPEGMISVEGEWELIGCDGGETGGRGQERSRSASEVCRLLGQHVVETQVSAPSWFSLRFSNGELLRVFDSSEEYESFSIQPGDVFV
jgi:hypothetical protein